MIKNYLLYKIDGKTGNQIPILVVDDLELAKDWEENPDEINKTQIYGYYEIDLLDKSEANVNTLNNYR